MSDSTWVLMPWRNNPEMTLHAVEDCLAQTVPTRVLLINQGASREDREVVDQWIDRREDHRVLPWNFLPALPSLSACWNRALNFVWELGGEEALVVNNDVRLHPRTIEWLRGAKNVADALFVSAVGVREGQFDPVVEGPLYLYDYAKRVVVDRGGPDFSCFLLTKEGHDRYPFDEGFIPAYCEDLDTHRRYLLGGDGSRIFSVNLPFLHYASGTLKQFTPEERAAFNTGYDQVLQRYTALWGGRPNEETYLRKGDAGSAVEDGTATTPYLQYHPPSLPDHAEDAGEEPTDV